MKLLLLILSLTISLVASSAVPNEASHLTDLYDIDSICTKDTDCGTGCCYNSLCLAHCYHEKPHTELIQPNIASTDTTKPQCHHRRDCKNGGCCYHGNCVGHICPKDPKKPPVARKRVGTALWARGSGMSEDGSAMNQNNQKCHTNRDCGTGCCYRGLCLAYCFGDARDEVAYAEVLSGSAKGDTAESTPTDDLSNLIQCRKDKYCKSGCCYHSFCRPCNEGDAVAAGGLKRSNTFTTPPDKEEEDDDDDDDDDDNQAMPVCDTRTNCKRGCCYHGLCLANCVA
ncbi:uncharacterized protein BO80DRAFT_463083 [Aspergillus ibericus CBS 121593]|uniref:Uncharacterized protein n=1 Tax=Aspergillus ibericus CBS 121593 TaxID=1448316 RepID=A0A395H6N8_9EURO|nr:hypothetical protein BO80DRAFT_463083 [Aspergillus ibericus CBS 121593]RAL02835.1 hypothetical protein BO80DRAFT_463083 [Aspergillus ibericus CBS 121593]